VIPNVLAASGLLDASSGGDPENSRVSMMRHPTDSATVKMAKLARSAALAITKVIIVSKTTRGIGQT
jgi:hypothetical protein